MVKFCQMYSEALKYSESQKKYYEFVVNGPNRLEIEGTKEILDIINNLKRQLTMGRSFAYSRLQRKYNFAKNRTGGSVRENVH